MLRLHSWRERCGLPSRKATFAASLMKANGWLNCSSLIQRLDMQIRTLKEQRLPVVTLEYVRVLLLALNVEAGEKQQVKMILTEQEIRVLRLIADGLANKEIAAKLGNASETIKWHIKSIYRKLGVSNRVQALQVAKGI